MYVDKACTDRHVVAERPYRAPQLFVYGDVRELTTAKASSNFGADNPMFPRLKT